jgi:tetratricopeptide (TPR) repeat protein
LTFAGSGTTIVPVGIPQGILMRVPVSSFASLFLLGATGVLAAQEHEHHGPAERLGRVEFPTSCAVQVQPRFERAMALLHSFWWEEAVRAFEEISAADPGCAMAQWGLAMAWWNNPFAGGPAGQALERGAAAARRGVELGAPTARERDWLAAVEVLYRNHETTSNAERLRAYSDAMAKVHERHPEDREAALYYALSLVATAPPTDTTFARQIKANGLLNPLFAEHPDHPGLAHYIIHANDSPRLGRYGLDAARRYAGIAPSVPHAQHMPSHIFIRLGLWEENIEANRRSYEAGARYAAEHFPPGALGGHEFHAMDYMVYGYLQLGRDSAAAYWTDHALATTDVVPPGHLVSEYARAAMPARMALERDRWREAARVPVPENPPPARLVAHFARGLGHARSGDTASAREEVDVIAAIETLLERSDPGWARVAGIKRRAVEAWVTLAAGDTAGAVALARAAADLEDVTEKHPVTPGEVLPARELYGDLLFLLGRYAEAGRAYKATLEREPGRARAIFGAARSAHMAGDRDEARARYREYLALMEKADGTRPELAVARRFAGDR